MARKKAGKGSEAERVARAQPSTDLFGWDRKQVSVDELVALYCEGTDVDSHCVKNRLQIQLLSLHCTGWMLLVCHQLDSSRVGQRVILPFGGDATWKEVPANGGPISPRGLASDMSMVAAFALVEA